MCRALRVFTMSRKFWIHESRGRVGKIWARSLRGLCRSRCVWGIFSRIRGYAVRVRVRVTLGLWPVHVVRVLH